MILLLLFEWLDPPFDGGHWITDMMRAAGVQPIVITTKSTTSSTSTSNLDLSTPSTATTTSAAGVQEQQVQRRKSIRLTWNQIRKQVLDDDDDDDDDITTLVACCGFNLERNIRDAYRMRDELQHSILVNNNNSKKEGQQGCHRRRRRIHAVDGDSYFAKPGPGLLIGAIIMSICAYSDQPAVVDAITSLSFCPKDIKDSPDTQDTQNPFWRYIDLDSSNDNNDDDDADDNNNPPSTTTNISTTASSPTLGGEDDDDGNVVDNNNNNIIDIEDFDSVHRIACDDGKLTYTDPSTGYQVYTEIAHKKRGKCCGSGCRHCPYNHENVKKDKANKIQQPAILYQATTSTSYNKDNRRRRKQKIFVIFVSGGKDSFLAIRAMIRRRQREEQQQQHDDEDWTFILLTTFDATSREIAHQEISIDIVIRQAQHQNMTLIGVPMHRGSNETYVNRIRRGINIIEKRSDKERKVHAFVFGDLHLEHVIQWREEHLGPLGYKMIYPLLHVSYDKLILDLESSKVPCIIAATTTTVRDDDDKVMYKVGTRYDRELYDNIKYNRVLTSLSTCSSTV